jgi:hypothetical protein
VFYKNCVILGGASRARFFFAGELPISIIKMKTQGIIVSLSGNTGLTLPTNIGQLGEIDALDLEDCSLTGASPFCLCTFLYYFDFFVVCRLYSNRNWKVGKFGIFGPSEQPADRLKMWLSSNVLTWLSFYFGLHTVPLFFLQGSCQFPSSK